MRFYPKLSFIDNLKQPDWCIKTLARFLDSGVEAELLASSVGSVNIVSKSSRTDLGSDQLIQKTKLPQKNP